MVDPKLFMPTRLVPCGARRNLPYDAEIEYIESTGEQWIDTGVYADTNTTVECEFFIKSSSGGFIYGGGSAWGSGCFGLQCIVYSATSRQFCAMAGNDYNAKVVDNNQINDRWLSSIQSVGHINIPNVWDANAGGTSGLPSPKAMLLFAFQRGNSVTDKISARIRRWKCGSVCDLISVRVGSVGYMYDRVTGRLFGNAGTGSFVLGPDKVETFADLAKKVRSFGDNQQFARARLTGAEIPDTWTDENGTVYSDPKIVQDVQEVQDPEGNTHLAAIPMPKYATKHDIQLDAPENGVEAYATEATAIEGIYYWGYGKDYAQATTYAVNAFCGYKGGIFQCTTAVSSTEAFDPSKWSLKDAVYYSDAKTYAVGDYAKCSGKIYQCTTAIETAEDWNPDHWAQISNASFRAGALVNIPLSTGATVPYTEWTAIYHTDVSSSNLEYFAYGYDRWEFSAIRQYFNSAEPIGEWWNPAHIGDCPPSQLATVRGYKAGCSAALLQYAKPIRVPVYPWNQSPQYTVDVFWLPSGTEMFGAVNSNEGSAFQKVQDNCYAASGWTTANNGDCSGRIYRRVSATGTAVVVWLRSVFRPTSYGAWYVDRGGNLHNYTVLNTYAGLPCCAIY